VTTDGRIVRIVVGVSGSSNSTAALRWAVSEARLRAAEVWAVHAWSSRTEMLAPYAPRHGLPSRDEQRELSSALLTSAIRRALESKGSGGVVRPVLVEGVPARVLLGYAASADLLVLGRRVGPNPLDGIALGAVARSCISNSLCSIVFIPAVNVGADTDTLSSTGWHLCVRQ
jgi:nucleotide-binding universal stress UspA family protein